MTPADRVWERIRQTSTTLAERKSIPSMRHAEGIVAQILRQEAVELPPPQTITSLAKELLRLISGAAA